MSIFHHCTAIIRASIERVAIFAKEGVPETPLEIVSYISHPPCILLHMDREAYNWLQFQTTWAEFQDQGAEQR
jgi:hypothetical protein